MQAKIIDRNVIPNRFTFYESDVNTTTLIFKASKINDGVDLSNKTAYLNIERDDLTTDKMVLDKTIGENEVYFSLLINNSITLKDGIVSAQISFENQDKSEIYKTNIFILDIMNSVKGNASFENVLPSVIDNLENEIASKVLDCEEIKGQAEEIKNQTQVLKGELEDLIENYEQNAVKSINGKKGEVSLTYQDVGAMPSSGTLPIMQRTLYPLNIDGAVFDGSNPVNIAIDGEYVQIDDENAEISLLNKGVYYLSNPKTLRILSNNFVSGTKALTSTVIINFTKDIVFNIAGDIEFSGEDTLDGKFFPKTGVYKIELFRLPNSTPIYAKCSKYKKTSCSYEEATTFDDTGNAKEDGQTYNYGFSGNYKITRNYALTPETIIEGFGTFVEDVYDGNHKKYKLDLDVCTNNFIRMKDFQTNIGSLSISTSSETGAITLNGRVDQAGTIEIPIEGGAGYNTTAYFRLYCLGGQLISTNTEQHIYFEVWDTTKVANKGEILGTNEFRRVSNELFYIYRDFSKIVFTINKNAIGSVFSNMQYAITAEFVYENSQYIKHQHSTTTIYLDEPILSLGDVQDTLNVYNGTITRRVKRVVIKSKDELVKDSSGMAVYKGKDGRGLIANNIPCNPEKMFTVNTFSDPNVRTYIVLNEDSIGFASSFYNNYDTMLTNKFPLVFMYTLKTPVVEKIPVAPLKYFKGHNRILFRTRLIPHETFCRIPKKD